MRNSPYGTVGPELVAAARAAVLLVFGLIALVVLGHGITKILVDSGVENFRSPEERRLAEAAVRVAWLNIDNPIQRVYTPAVRVTVVERAPGHCDDPTIPEGPRKDYRAKVSIYTLFAIPARTAYLTCGGRYMGPG